MRLENKNEEQVSGCASIRNYEETGEGKGIGCRIPTPDEEHL
jgi:hypothetical protein